jgi:hypothetical protein
VVPFDRSAVAIARPALEQLAITLRSSERVQPRAVALIRLVLTGLDSPLYAPEYTGQLYDVARDPYRAVGGAWGGTSGSAW